MRLTFLGTGTSVGVPVIGCDCDVCRSHDFRDKRLRCSAMVETEHTRIIIDAGPDFREQMLCQEFRKIDAVLLTHIHYDHVGGIDDLRPFCVFGDINVYADERTAKGLKQTVPYCFTEVHYPGVPEISLHAISPHEPLIVNEIEVVPIRVYHGKLPILGYRIGKLAYITDMKYIDDCEMEFLKGVEVLVVNALRYVPSHHSHQDVHDALRFSEKVGARRTLFTHMCHDIGLHSDVCARLPQDVELAYDGLIVEF